MLRSNLTRSLLTFVAILCIYMSSQAGIYVSYKGHFTITYPDNWEQIDYNTADLYLSSINAGNSALDYEAVFAPIGASPYFFSGAYLILNVDTLDGLTETLEDSIVREFTGSFGKNAKYFPVGDFLSNLKANAPTYDTARKILTVLNDVVLRDEITKNLIVRRLCEQSIATFYFYAPDSLFEQSTEIFHSIVESFSTDNIESALPRETVTVSDLDDNDEEHGNSGRRVALWVTLGVVLLAVIRRKRRRKQQGQE